MSKAEQLHIHISERSALLERAMRVLEQDRRVAAAWLHGSMGRGAHDEWSDIDLWIVVADDQMDALRAERHDFVSSIGTTLLTIEAPQNAPPGGAYLLAMYPGTNGPHILDCSWQPESSARKPADTLLLFERLSIKTGEPPGPQSRNARLEGAVGQTRFFWMMATIVAKHVARHDTWEAIKLLSFLDSVLREIEWLVGKRVAPATYRDHPDFAPPVTPLEQSAALSNLMARMSELMRNVPTLQSAITQQALDQVSRFCSLVEEVVKG